MTHPQIRSRVARIADPAPVSPSTPRQVLRTDDGVTFHVHAVRRGGMGVVYICSTDESPEAHFALKTFDDAHFFEPLMQAAVETEARLWMRVSGVPHVLPLITIAYCDQKPFLVMPAIPPGAHGGVSLADEIHHATSGLPADQCFQTALGVAMALAACCERVPGLVHGDIKPDNILLVSDGVPYLTDFGAARLFSQAPSGQAVHGTGLYLAPECWDPDPVYSETSDVYAFGATLFEMLSGQPPFGAIDNPVILAEQHREHVPTFPVARTGSALERALMQLALACLAKRASARPLNGTALRDRLIDIGKEHDPNLLVLSFMQAAQAHMPSQSAELTGTRVRSLLRQGDGVTALALLDTLPAERVDGILLLHYGSAYSLAGRDSEAIPWFERYLAQETDAAQRTIAQNELGLSFKRLGRLEEARTLYVGLIAHAPQDLQLMVRSNYAATLMELGEVRRANEIMRALTRQHPNSPEAWAILAQALANAGEAKKHTAEAINAIRNAVRLAPRQGQYRVMLANMLMETTQDLPAALEALDAAYGLGHHTRDWLVNTLTCNLLLDRRQHVEELLLLCSKQLPEAATREILDDALAMFRRIVDSATTAPPPAAAPAVEQATVPLEPSQDGVKRPEAGAVQPADGAPPAVNDDDEQFRTRIRQGIQAYVQLRMSYVDGSTLADFYYGVDRSDYVEVLVDAVARIKAETLGMTAGLQRRAKPHEFARCPHCATFMLSQRDEGESYKCQGCLTQVNLHIVRDAALEGLLKRALVALGETPRDAGLGTLFVAIAGDNTRQEQIIERAFGRAGYISVANACTARKIFGAEALKRGLHYPASARIWMRELAAGQLASVEDGTLEELDRLLRTIRRSSGSTWSMSMLLEDPQSVQLALSGEREYAETMIMLAEKTLNNGELMGCAVHAAIMVGEVGRARQLLGRSRLLRPDDRHTALAAALIEIAEGRCAEAIPKLQSVLEANPRDEFARLTLATAYDAAGDATQAAGALARLRADGVVPWPHERSGTARTRDQED